MKKGQETALILSFPVAVVSAFLTRDFWRHISGKFPECIFLKITGYYCPGCGNTRSLLAFLHGDIIGALHNNITPILLFALLLLLYVEFLFSVSGRTIKLLPRNGFFWGNFIGAVLSYYVVRNFWGIIAPVAY